MNRIKKKIEIELDLLETELKINKKEIPNLTKFGQETVQERNRVISIKIDSYKEVLKWIDAFLEEDKKKAEQMFQMKLEFEAGPRIAKESWDDGAIGGTNLLGDDYNRIRSEDKPMGAPFHND